MRATKRSALTLLLLGGLAGVGCDGGSARGAASEAGREARTEVRPAVLDLWEEGRPAFGIFVPDERPPESRAAGAPRPAALYTEDGGERHAANPLLDFLFLNLEPAYDAEAVRALAAGMGRSPGQAPALLVRLPAMHEAGEEATRDRVRESLELGADGIVLPHVRSPDEARQAVRILEELGADVWSPDNPGGKTVLMLMLEDPDAVSRAREFAEIPGYSVLACGIGSLRGALGGDGEAAEAGTQAVLAEARRAGLPNMITANAEDIEERLDEGFLGLLMSGAGADETIRIGRTAAGRGLSAVSNGLK